MIQVLVAEDVPVMAQTLTALLGLESDIEVRAAVASGDLMLPARP